jgi:hypothetical protein
VLIPANEERWRSIGIMQRDDGPNGGTFQWRFDLPEPLASWDVFAQWERRRFESMRDNFLEGLGYRSEHLATDHEEHWMFW